jgi:hypothetical protein
LQELIRYFYQGTAGGRNSLLPFDFTSRGSCPQSGVGTSLDPLKNLDNVELRLVFRLLSKLLCGQSGGIVLLVLSFAVCSAQNPPSFSGQIYPLLKKAGGYPASLSGRGCSCAQRGSVWQVAGRSRGREAARKLSALEQAHQPDQVQRWGVDQEGQPRRGTVDELDSNALVAFGESGSTGPRVSKNRSQPGKAVHRRCAAPVDASTIREHDPGR